MAVSIVMCANDAERQVAVDALQAAGNAITTFPAADGLAVTATVSGNRLVQTSVVSAAFVVVGTPQG
ncbi:MAG: hypothetical protein WDN08_03455 [Rhizomicrobium sp.]